VGIRSTRTGWGAYPWGDEFDGTRVNYCDKNCTHDRADTAVDDGYVYTAPVGSYLEGASWVGRRTWRGTYGSGAARCISRICISWTVFARTSKRAGIEFCGVGRIIVTIRARCGAPIATAVFPAPASTTATGFVSPGVPFRKHPDLCPLSHGCGDAVTHKARRVSRPGAPALHFHPIAFRQLPQVFANVRIASRLLGF
jgi:hypothetical protein